MLKTTNIGWPRGRTLAALESKSNVLRYSRYMVFNIDSARYNNTNDIEWPHFQKPYAAKRATNAATIFAGKHTYLNVGRVAAPKTISQVF